MIMMRFRLRVRVRVRICLGSGFTLRYSILRVCLGLLNLKLQTYKT
jgi:hypothetical protein